jgi:hypothetical protein
MDPGALHRNTGGILTNNLAHADEFPYIRGGGIKEQEEIRTMNSPETIPVNSHDRAPVKELEFLHVCG